MGDQYIVFAHDNRPQSNDNEERMQAMQMQGMQGMSSYLRPQGPHLRP